MAKAREVIKFPAAVTEQEIELINSKLNDDNVLFRVALVLLNKDSKELEEMARKDTAVVADIVEKLGVARGWAESRLELIDKAENRLFAACHNVGLIDVTKRAKRKKRA